MHVLYSLREWVEGTYDDFSGVKVSVTIANTLQASAYVMVQFPPGFHIDDGGAVNIILFIPVATGV
jgi:hypothetical protein